MVKQSCQFGEEGDKGTFLEGLPHLRQDLVSEKRSPVNSQEKALSTEKSTYAKALGRKGAWVFKELKGGGVAVA